MKGKGNRETLKRLLVEFREEDVPDDLRRRKRKVDLKRKKANVLTGIRRSGKTYTMYQKIKDLEGECTHYVNFEDERLVNPTLEDLSELLPVIQETFDTVDPVYLFVDEIQNVEDWEKWATRMAEKGDVVLTLSGSSSKLSSREIATSLRGRTRTTYIFPLGFREFLDFRNCDLNLEKIEYSEDRPRVKRYFNEYLKYGGYPEIALEDEEGEKLKILREYFSTIVARDLVERYTIDKFNAFESFMKLLINNFSRPISFSKARDWMGSMGIDISKNTLSNYFNYLKSSYFLFDTTIYSESVKDRLQYPRKVYLIDNGFATALTEQFSSDRGWFFENLMAINLYKDTVSDPRKEIYYWKRDGKEIDFVVRSGVETEKLIQVCSNLNEKTRDREVGNLLAASEDLNCNNLKVITEDLYEERKIEGKNVKFVPLWMELL